MVDQASRTLQVKEALDAHIDPLSLQACLARAAKDKVTIVSTWSGVLRSRSRSQGLGASASFFLDEFMAEALVASHSSPVDAKFPVDLEPLGSQWCVAPTVAIVKTSFQCNIFILCIA